MPDINSNSITPYWLSYKFFADHIQSFLASIYHLTVNTFLTPQKKLIASDISTLSSITRIFKSILPPAIYNTGFTSPLAIVPLPASFNSGSNVNVLPKSLITFITGVSLVSFVSHQVTTTLFVSESTSTLMESASFL